MLSPTLAKGLGDYDIGPKLRALRLQKKLGLVELGRHTGLSAALLSKIERGRVFPTLPTLLRIALVFSVGLDYFFAADSDRHPVAIVRRKERLRFPEKAGQRSPAYHFECLVFPASDRKLDAFHAEFNPIDATKLQPHEHPGVEFLYVMRGRLEIRIGRETHLLHAGDSIYFDATMPHGYRRLGSAPCDALVVTVP